MASPVARCFEIAAQHDAGIANERRLQRRADRADDGDGADAERQAGEQDAEAAQVAAQIDQRDAEPAGQRAHRRRPAARGEVALVHV